MASLSITVFAEHPLAQSCRRWYMSTAGDVGCAEKTPFPARTLSPYRELGVCKGQKMF